MATSFQVSRFYAGINWMMKISSDFEELMAGPLAPVESEHRIPDRGAVAKHLTLREAWTFAFYELEPIVSRAQYRAQRLRCGREAPPARARKR
jgi:hypothetical protein